MSKPYKIVYGIRKTGLADEQGQERDQWTQIGVAFPNQDGSLNVILHYLPTDLAQTRLHIRDPRPKEEQPAPQEPPMPHEQPKPPPRRS
jgi:hypothetical protein